MTSICSPTIVPSGHSMKEKAQIGSQKEALQFEIFTSIHAVGAVWDDLIEENNLFLSTNYLSVVERFPASGMTFYYVLCRFNGLPVGLAYFQQLHYSFQQSLNFEGKPAWNKWLAKTVDLLPLNLLVCGSVFLTGIPGYYFKTATINSKTPEQLLLDISTLIYRKSGLKSAPILIIKDLHSKGLKKDAFFPSQNFSLLPLQPAMLLNLKEKWQVFEDYLADMSSKYRIRAKKALKMSKALLRREIFLEEFHLLKGRCYELYMQVALSAGFNISFLHPDYFYQFKKAFPERFRVFGYFVESKLIGFYTTFLNHHELEAHFLGFEAHYNKTAQLYLNMLYDIIKNGIEQGGVEQIHFARTALEIKSSVGAVPVYFQSFGKHLNPALNFLMFQSIRYFSPKENWVQRHPFKDE